MKPGVHELLYPQCLNYLSDLDQHFLVLDLNGSKRFDAALQKHRRSLLHKNNGMLSHVPVKSHSLFLEFVTLHCAYYQDLERAVQFVQNPPIVSLNATERALLSSRQPGEESIPVRALRLYEHRRNTLENRIHDLVRSTDAVNNARSTTRSTTRAPNNAVKSDGYRRLWIRVHPRVKKLRSWRTLCGRRFFCFRLCSQKRVLWIMTHLVFYHSTTRCGTFRDTA